MARVVLILSIFITTFLYCVSSSFVNLDSARQSQIEALWSDRRGTFPVGLLKTREGPGDLLVAKQVSLRTGTAEEEDRFGKVAASPNSQKLTRRSTNAFSFKDKIINGSVGDYVVTQQAGTYTILLIRSITPQRLIIEEIDVPTIQLDPKKVTWKEWISKQAPGHTAWISYHIDLEKNKLLQSYCHSKNAWLYANDPNHFLTRLLTLPLEKTPPDKRKKIGPPPTGEEDHRALWMPSVIFEGTKVDKPALSAWYSHWPKDDSLISECEIEIYFSQFTFPYWIEIRSSHYKASIQTIDSGQGMVSPKPIVFKGH